MSEETDSGIPRTIEFHVNSYPGGVHPTPLEMKLGEETAILLLPCDTTAFPGADKGGKYSLDIVLSRTEPEQALQLLEAAKDAIDVYLQALSQSLEAELSNILGGEE